MKFLKLLKYEFLENIAPIVLINILLLVSLCVMSAYFKGHFDNLAWFGIFIVSIPIIMFVLFIFLLNIIIKTLYERLFAKEIYLTFSLPVSIDEILISKILISMLWLIISAFVICLWLCIEGGFVNFFGIIARNYISVILFTLFSLLSILKSVVLVLLVLSILHIGKIAKFRKIIGITLFFVISIIEATILAIILSISDIFVTLNNHSVFNPLSIQMQTSQIIFQFIAVILPIFVYYFLSRYLIKNKLEI